MSTSQVAVMNQNPATSEFGPAPFLPPPPGKAGRKQEPAPAPQEKVGGETKERRMRRVRRGSARKRLDTINSESEYSVMFCIYTKLWLTLKIFFFKDFRGFRDFV